MGFGKRTPGNYRPHTAQSDSAKPITLVGEVTKFEWTNPHARFYIDVKDDKGLVTNWNLELASPNILTRNDLLGPASAP